MVQSRIGYWYEDELWVKYEELRKELIERVKKLPYVWKERFGYLGDYASRKYLYRFEVGKGKIRCWLDKGFGEEEIYPNQVPLDILIQIWFLTMGE